MQWIKVWNRPFSLQKDLISIFSWFAYNRYHKLPDQIWVPQGKTKGDAYYPERHWNKLMRKLASEPLHKDQFYATHLKRYALLKQRLLKRAQSLRAATKPAIPAAVMLREYQRYYREFREYSYFFFFPWALNQFLDPWLQKRLRVLAPAQHLTLYHAITQPTKDITMNQQLRVLLKLKITHQLKEKITHHVNKYSWLPVYNYADTPWTKRDFLAQLKTFTTPQKTLTQMATRLKANRRNLKQALGGIKDKRTRMLAKLINEYIWLRTERIDTWRRAMYLVQPFFRELERRAKLPWGSAIHLTIREIEDFLRVGKPIPQKLLRERLIHRYILRVQGQLVRVITDPAEQAHILHHVLRVAKVTKLRSFGGRTVFPGKVRGRVRLIMNPQDVRQFEPNEILVSNMTHPDYLLALQKAKAIVTDEGGITSHAAITCRELKIPGIIGTKIATRILKNGDRVEVNATKGRLRLLRP